ncbi:hypothetical protein HY492_03550 [Candidatus Woesearchaeota archaeon]|nr:hypothetical protein [Candidatus Woesearchaeota archaeon]
MSSFKETGLNFIKNHPRIFSALEEFERTKKVPKFTYRKRIDVTINENVLKRFKHYCEEHGINVSRKIEQYMKEELA